MDASVGVSEQNSRHAPDRQPRSRPFEATSTVFTLFTIMLNVAATQ